MGALIARLRKEKGMTQQELAVGGLVIFRMGKLSVSDLGVMLCIAVALLAIDSLNR